MCGSLAAFLFWGVVVIIQTALVKYRAVVELISYYMLTSLEVRKESVQKFPCSWLNRQSNNKHEDLSTNKYFIFFDENS